MNGWDFLAATNCFLGGIFLVIHAVMVGNPEYGWQPKSLMVRTVMVIVALCLFARGYTAFMLHDPVSMVGQVCAAGLSGLFFVSWLDMMITSWRREIKEERDTAISRMARALLIAGRRAQRAEKAAKAAISQSTANGATLDKIADTVSILEPAPTEFKDGIGWHPGKT